jgi:hypothetical protein
MCSHFYYNKELKKSAVNGAVDDAIKSAAKGAVKTL